MTRDERDPRDEYAEESAGGRGAGDPLRPNTRPNVGTPVARELRELDGPRGDVEQDVEGEATDTRYGVDTAEAARLTVRAAAAAGMSLADFETSISPPPPPDPFDDLETCAGRYLKADRSYKRVETWAKNILGKLDDQRRYWLDLAAPLAIHVRKEVGRSEIPVRFGRVVVRKRGAKQVLDEERLRSRARARTDELVEKLGEFAVGELPDNADETMRADRAELEELGECFEVVEKFNAKRFASRLIEYPKSRDSYGVAAGTYKPTGEILESEAAKHYADESDCTVSIKPVGTSEADYMDEADDEETDAA